jgi:hypothetical protein
MSNCKLGFGVKRVMNSEGEKKLNFLYVIACIGSARAQARIVLMLKAPHVWIRLAPR